MAKRKGKQPSPLPKRSSSHVKEDESNDIFRDQIKPWMFRGALSREYGIDGYVEVTRSLSDSKDQIVTGKRFSVQLKSSTSLDFGKSSFSISVPIGKINYWIASIEPVLIVLVDVSSRTCFYRWVDESLIQSLYNTNPEWVAQDTVSISISADNKITQSALLSLERYIFNWKRFSKTILTPGSYFKFSNEAKVSVDTFLSKIKEYNIEYLSKETGELWQSTSQSIYTIATVGPNKAGKSTLINCFLQKKVSPVGMLPTTGIPITIFPNSENRVHVILKDKTVIEGNVDEPFLREYTSKDRNPNNEKKVSIVSVHVINTFLERGFAICDVPGLDDADAEIRKITKATLYSVNAIIYVISAAPMASGDFSLNKQVIEDLHELGGRMDRIFLVFNKIDMLDAEQLEQLKRYVNATLEQYDILKYLPVEPIYISTSSSFANRIENCNSEDSVGTLEQELWRYLLSSNKTGLHKILGIFGDCLKVMERMNKLVSAKMIDSEKAANLKTEIRQISSEVSHIRNLVIKNRKEIYVLLSTYLNNSFDDILDYLESDLQNVPLNYPLITNHQITQWLEDQAYRAISELYAGLQQKTYELQSIINQWISEKLRQVEIVIEDPNHTGAFKMPDINKYTNQVSRNYYDKERGYLGFIEWIIVGIGEILGKAVQAVADIFTADGVKREKQIKEIMSKSRRSYNTISRECLVNLDDYLTNICRNMEEKSIDRTQVYLGELSSQLKSLSNPISSKEKEKLKRFLDEISQIERGIQANLMHLKEYTENI